MRGKKKLKRNMEFDILRGKDLDRMAYLHGLSRKKYFFFFKESDESLRKRILDDIVSASLRPFVPWW